MARPRKPEAERIEDAFFDMSLADQDSMLRTLATLHRMKARQSSKRATEPAPDEQPMLDGVAK